MEYKIPSEVDELTVDFGDHIHPILAGIKQEYANPAGIEGKQALFVVNLPDRRWPASFMTAPFVTLMTVPLESVS